MQSFALQLVLLLVISGTITSVNGNDFPSLLVKNATVAIILDQEYLGLEYGETLDKMHIILEKALRENMKEGGLTVKFFSWSLINFNKDFTAVLSITNCKNTWTTYHSAMQENLLYIALTDPDCPRLPAVDAIMIPIITVGQELPQLVLDIRAAHAINWKTAVIIYDETFDRDTISRVIMSMSSESARNHAAMTLSLFKISTNNTNGDAIRRTFNMLSSTFIGKNYIVITTTPREVLRIASEMGMLDTGSQWLFLLSVLDNSGNSTMDTYNVSGIARTIQEGANVAFAVNSTRNGLCAVQTMCIFENVVTLLVSSVTKLIGMEQAIYGQISDEEWEAIRFSKKERRNTMLEFIRQNLVESNKCETCLQWDLMAMETWGVRTNNAKSPAISAIENLFSKENKSIYPELYRAAVWDPTNGLLTEDEIFPHIAHGFRNKVLPIVAYHNPPWQIFTYTESGEIASFRGVVSHILNEIAEKLNFTYTIIDPTKRANLTTLVNDDINTNATNSMLNVPAEVLDMIAGDRVFFGACGITVTEYFRRSVNFTRPFSIQSHSLLISRPKELGRLYLFMAPFSNDTWLCLILTIVLIGPLLFAINFLTPYNEHINILKSGGLYKISNCCWYIYGALLQQGGMYLPRSDSARIIVGTWWLVVLVVVTTYCGNLVAFLTFPKIDTPISNIDELLQSEDMSWGLRSNTYLEDYLKNSNYGPYQQLIERANIYAEESREIIDRVRQGKHVYIDWKSNLQYIMKREFLETDRCDFSLGSDEFIDEQIALVVSPRSPYLDIIDQEIYRLQQMGFVQKWLAEYLPSRDRCWNGGKMVEIENHTVNLNDMQGCFLVLFIGMVASGFIITCECVFKWHQTSKASKLIKPFSD